MIEESLQSQMNTLNTGHALNRKELEYVKGTTERIEKKLDNFIDCADDKYAPIFAWQVLKWAGAVVGGIIITALMYSIITN